ncbi:NAD(P)H-binding protein [Curtobacterium sp. MCBD17_028]|uniref:NmrA family NAD(P)-binding protein n=1 Tax=Curtobacterium sp. MCBD17_028 TaxID=2175670 RepID=UPI000DA871B7|nr:NAD(P)H-binding protein [Curtobacterium sp. MCBD17_028]PZE27298.1 SDR family NAD(P)-dependent oxidoreductase [Curtobacterium sp. MCBD17_028]
MITITGATGALNGATVDHLLQHLPASELTVVTRDPARAARFAERGVTVRQGDYDDPAGLPAAFAGADHLLLVSSNDPAGDTISQHRNAVEAAITAGVGHVLYTSHQGAGAASPFVPARHHAATEDMLASSGLPWTSLRNGFYAHSLQWLLGPWQRTGVVSIPADGPVSWTAREDAAEAAAAILLLDEPVEGPVTITAPEAPTFADLTRSASDLVGNEVRFEVVDDDVWVERAVAGGQQEPMVRFLLGMYLAAEQGWFAGTDPMLGELLGRAPRSAQDVLREVVTGRCARTGEPGTDAIRPGRP